MSGEAQPRILGPVACYADLHELMRARADELELSRTTIDRLAGLSPGYAGKLLSPRPIKKLSDETLGYVLPALGVKLVLMVDLQSVSEIEARASKRISACASHAGTVRYTISRRELRRRQRKGGRNSRKNLTPSQVKRLARKAGIAGNKARWHTPTVTEITR